MEIKDKTTRGKWYVINIKARERQQPEHYVQGQATKMVDDSSKSQYVLRLITKVLKAN